MKIKRKLMFQVKGESVILTCCSGYWEDSNMTEEDVFPWEDDWFLESLCLFDVII